MQEKLVLKKSVKQSLCTIIFLLIGMIISKQSPELKTKIKESIYEKSLPMIKLREQYNKYFSWNTNETIKNVMAEKIQYKRKKETESGVKLVVDNQQPIPLIESGMIILVESNNIVIEQIDGVTAIYSNIDRKNYKLYYYIEKGEVLGEAISEEITVSFVKEGNYYDYKHYL